MRIPVDERMSSWDYPAKRLFSNDRFMVADPRGQLFPAVRGSRLVGD